jgi:purine-cytosine permease-like protein
MKGNKLLPAIFKSLLCMACMFVIGFLGYHYPDIMMVVISVAIFCAFSWYFYAKSNED